MAASRTAIIAVKRYGLYSTPLESAPEAATQTFLRGSPVVASSGFLQEAAADPRSIVGIANNVGQNGTAAGDKDTQYVPAIEGVVFEGSVDNTAAGTGVIAATDMFSEFGITEDGSNIWYIDKDKTTGGNDTVARIVGFKDPVAEVMGRVYFIFLSEVSILHT